jgi:uncharacterized protein DUF6907
MTRRRKGKRPSWMVEKCPDWCFNPHEECDAYDDRNHFGPTEKRTPVIDLSLHDPVIARQTRFAGEVIDTTWRPANVMIDLDQHVDSHVAKVRVRVDQGNAILTMTTSEAREVAAGIVRVSDMAERAEARRQKRGRTRGNPTT